MDLFVSGVVYPDVMVTGLPRPGQKAWAPGTATSPGYIAHLAVAASRLGRGAAFSTAAVPRPSDAA